MGNDEKSKLLDRHDSDQQGGVSWLVACRRCCRRYYHLRYRCYRRLSNKYVIC
jgi:hypothetical protein